MISREDRERLLQSTFSVADLAGHQLKVPDLAENPGAVFSFVGRRRLVRHVHQLKRAIQVAEEFAQICGAGYAWQVSWTEVEHPLRGFFGIVVVAKFDVCVGEEPVEHHVIRHFLVQLFGLFEGCAELVFAEQQPNRRSLAVEVVRRNFEGFFERVLGLVVVNNIRSFTGATR